jgi:arylsulfatase A-like enzyme
MEHQQPKSSTSIARYAGLGALVGLLLGFVEAFYLSRYTRPPGMLKLNVTWAIWFVGPLLDGAAGGVLGSLTGLIIANHRCIRAWRKMTEVLRSHAIPTLALVICAVGLVFAGALMSNEYALRFVKVAVILLLPSAAHWVGKSLRPKILGMTLSYILFVLLTGMGIYCLRSPLPSSTAAAAPLSDRGKPNIILITLDTVRADHLSLYGYPRPTTPNIDRWAHGGVVFENAIAPTSWTLASHASIFTGLLPHQHGADWQIPLNTGRWTLADALKAWGYETAGFTSNIGYGEAGWGLDEGFELYEDNRSSVLHNLQALELGRRIIGPLYRRWVWPEYFERRHAFQVNRDILDWLHRRSPSPYFLFINYFDAHDPYLAPGDHAHQFGDAPPVLIRRTKFAFTSSGAVHLSDQDRSALIAAYDNSLASLDDSVGELLGALSRLPQWDNTVVIITSDHGEAFGEHGTYCHGENLYSESVHVPLVVFGPGIPKGVRVSPVVSTQDLFSTALQFTEVGGAEFSRTALQRYWTPGIDPGEWDESVISELTPKYGFTGLWPQMSLRTREWEYFRDSRGREELYHWTQDPGEQVNLAASAEYRPIVDALHARLCTLISDSRRPWERPQYLSALDEPRRPFVNVADSFAALASAQRDLRRRIGDAQDRFPPRVVVSRGMPPTPDRDLLQSLPYH